MALIGKDQFSRPGGALPYGRSTLCLEGRGHGTPRETPRRVPLEPPDTSPLGPAELRCGGLTPPQRSVQGLPYSALLRLRRIGRCSMLGGRAPQTPPRAPLAPRLTA